MNDCCALRTHSKRKTDYNERFLITFFSLFGQQKRNCIVQHNYLSRNSLLIYSVRDRYYCKKVYINIICVIIGQMLVAYYHRPQCCAWISKRIDNNNLSLVRIITVPIDRFERSQKYFLYTFFIPIVIKNYYFPYRSYLIALSMKTYTFVSFRKLFLNQ